MSPTNDLFLRNFHHLWQSFGNSSLGLQQLPFTTNADDNEGSHSCFLDDQSTTKFFLDISENHPCAGMDWFVLAVLCVVVHVTSWVPRWLIYEPLFLQLRSSKGDLKVQRFSQVLTATSFHIIMAYLAWQVLWDKEWLWNVDLWSQQLVTVGSEGAGSSTIEGDFKFYYLLYAARYISDFISLFFEPTKSDTLAYGIHHVVTIGLVLLSAQCNCTRIGGVLMYFFDWADPPMLLGKAMLYLSLEQHDLYQQIADVFMGIFVLLFVATRNIVFTAVVYVAMRDFPNSNATILTLKALLVALVGLMMFWLGLIVKTIYYQFFHNRGHVDDLRENSEHTNKMKAA